MELKKTTLVVLFIAFGFCSCSILNKNNKVIEPYLEAIDERSIIEESEQFFLRNQDGYVYFENGDYIKDLYLARYKDKYTDYYAFKRTVINDSVIPPLPSDMRIDDCRYDVKNRFVIDSVVWSVYNKHTIDSFISKYCHKTYERYEFNEDYPKNVRMTIAFCLWLTGKYYFQDAGISGLMCIGEDSTFNALSNLRNIQLTKNNE